MNDFHPEQYFPIAFFVIILVNFVAVSALVTIKSLRSSMSKKADKRIKALCDDVAESYRTSSKAENEDGFKQQLRNLRFDELRRAAQFLHKTGNLGLCDLLCRMLNRTGRMDQVLRTSANGGKWEQIDALLLLGYLRHLPAMLLLRRALRSPDPDVVYAAVTALSLWNSKESIETLVLLLHKGSTMNPSRVATAIEGATADISDALCRKSLVDDPVTQYWTATLLGRYPTLPARTALKNLTSNTNANVRAAAFSSLAKVGDGNGNTAVVSGLEDPEWFVRAQAARACGEQRVVNALPRLTALMGDPEWWVRADAREALQAIGPPAIQHLLEALSGTDRFARNMAAEALDNMGYVDSAIWDLNKGGVHRERALETLSAIRKAEGAPALADKLNRLDPDLFDQVKDQLELARSA